MNALVQNLKRQSGKTSICINLATANIRSGNKVLFVRAYGKDVGWTLNNVGSLLSSFNML